MTDDQVRTGQHTSAADHGRDGDETAREQPAIVIISRDPGARERLDRELSRQGSVKRVASAVGKGAVTIPMIHRRLDAMATAGGGAGR
jgi:hypothetical protein